MIVMDMGKETTGGGAANFCRMRYNLLVSADVTEFQTPEAYSTFDLKGVKHNV
jgi:hypothetical protein